MSAATLWLIRFLERPRIQQSEFLSEAIQLSFLDFFHLELALAFFRESDRATAAVLKMASFSLISTTTVAKKGQGFRVQQPFERIAAPSCARKLSSDRNRQHLHVDFVVTLFRGRNIRLALAFPLTFALLVACALGVPAVRTPLTIVWQQWTQNSAPRHRPTPSAIVQRIHAGTSNSPSHNCRVAQS